MLWIGRNRKDGGFEMTEAEKKKMQEQGAIGNSPVETKKGGANAEPVLKSPNEPVTPAPQPILSNEQIAQNREANIAAKEQILSSVAKDIESQPQKRIVEEHKEKIIEKPQTITAEDRGPKYKEYDTTPFDRKAEEENYQKSQSFKDILALADAQNKQYEQKAVEAKRNAKYNALGNLLVSLGQIAGGGKQTYVKPTTGKYLTESMAKAEQARELYDKVKSQNEERKATHKEAYLDKLEKNYYENQRRKNAAIEAHNNLEYKNYKNSKDEARSQMWLDYQIQNLLANQKIKQEQLEQKAKDAAANRAAKAAESEANRKSKESIAAANNKSREAIADKKGSGKTNRFITQEKDDIFGNIPNPPKKK
jgi:hypothetical protein